MLRSEFSSKNPTKLAIISIPTAGHISPLIRLAQEAKINNPHLNVLIVLTSWVGYTIQPKNKKALEEASNKLCILESKETAKDKRNIFGRVIELIDDVIEKVRGCDYILYDFMAPEGFIAAKYLKCEAISVEPSFVGKFDTSSEEYSQEFKNCRNDIAIINQKYSIDLSDKLKLTDGVLAVPATKNILFSYKKLIYAGDFSKNTDDIKKQYYFMRPTPLINPELDDKISFIKKSDKKIIYFSLGTIASGLVWDILDKNTFRDFIRFLYHSLILLSTKRHDLILIISAGRNPKDILGDDYSLPDNVFIFEHLDQSALLYYTDIFITHAGANSLNEAIDNEVPTILIPLMFDQHGAALAANKLNVGIAFLHKENKDNHSVVTFSSDQYYRYPFQPGKIDEAAMIFEKTINKIFETDYFLSFLKIKQNTVYTFKDIERIFNTKAEKEEKYDSLKNDLESLQEIFSNELYDDRERHSKIRELQMHRALYSETGVFPIVKTLFDNLPPKYWPALFFYFDRPIIVLSFLQNISNEEKIEETTWIAHQSQWESILYGTLLSILDDFFREDFRGSMAKLALFELDRAFAKSEHYFPGMVDQILKKFFFIHLPNSIKIFIKMSERMFDCYDMPYYSKEKITRLVASWLPEDTLERTSLLAKLLHVDKTFEQILKIPFVRNKEEVAQTCLSFIRNSSENFINLFWDLSGEIKNIFFKSLYQSAPEILLNLLKSTFFDLGTEVLSDQKPYFHIIHYTRTVLMLLSHSMRTNIDIFKIIDADLHKQFLLEILSESYFLFKKCSFPLMFFPYKLIYTIFQHYRPEQVNEMIEKHIADHRTNDRFEELILCIYDFQQLTNNQAQFNNHLLINYFKKNMIKLFNAYDRNKGFSVMASLVPHFDTLSLEFMAKSIEDGVSIKHEICLDNLVRIYGFSSINDNCLKLKLSSFSTYLEKKFSKFPDYLNQIDKALTTYSAIFQEDAYHRDISVYCFNEYLTIAINNAVKDSKTTFDVDIAEICKKSKIEPTLAALLPPLKIESRKLLEVKPSTPVATDKFFEKKLNEPLTPISPQQKDSKNNHSISSASFSIFSSPKDESSSLEKEFKHHKNKLDENDSHDQKLAIQFFDHYAYQGKERMFCARAAAILANHYVNNIDLVLAMKYAKKAANLDESYQDLADKISHRKTKCCGCSIS